MDFCSNETKSFIYSNLNNDGFKEASELYKYFCPVLIIGSFVSVLINSLLFYVGHKYTRNKSPVLLLSLNLASTDTLASLMMGLGLIFNAYLPVVFGIRFERCHFLAFEILRTGAFIASVLHLLALASLHYKGIVNPLHHRTISICSLSSVTSSIHLITLCCWALPLTVVTAYFLSIPCQAFLSPTCDIDFLIVLSYRILILVCFALPLVAMATLYIRVFVLIKRHVAAREALSEATASSRPTVTTVTLRSLAWYHKLFRCSRGTRTTMTSANQLAPPSPEVSAHLSASPTPSLANATTSSSPGSTNGSNSKALSTTLIILGTYLLCWMPAVTFLALTCVDGCPFPITRMAPVTRVSVSFVMNSLVCLKALVDPFIYTFRMKEVRLAVRKFLTGQRRNSYRPTLSSRPAPRSSRGERSFDRN